ncbi:MAG: hypothetical protein DRG78_03280 [Epsilonproteobacteria bacterium]|nr:MAG: hypothetical protein DRG78_03280 [Campylobacterota bacterium]
MRGKTKSFFEDTSIIAIVLAVIYGIYYLYSNYDVETKVKPPIKEEIKKEIIDKKIVKIEKTEPIKPQTIESKIKKKAKIIDKEIVVKKTIIKEEIIVKKEKNVDLKLLRSFLIETQYKIRNNIVYPSDTNKTKENLFIKVKVTILKDGSYEQLKFVDGDKEMFESNKENILKVFPLVIDKKISDDFPRYFRMTIK